MARRRTYTVTAPAALSVTGLSPDRVLPVPAGTPVTWEATATGGAGPYTYKFHVFNGSAWTIGQDWSAANMWTWVPLRQGRTPSRCGLQRPIGGGL